MKTQLKWLALAFPVALVAGEPVYHVAMDGSLDAFGADKAKIKTVQTKNAADFVPGVFKQALSVVPEKPAPCLMKLPGFNYVQATVAFWFRPAWKEGESAWIINSRDTDWKPVRFYLLHTKDGNFDLSVCMPGQVQIFGKDSLKPGEWAHIAFTWDLQKSEIQFFLNGKPVRTRTVKDAFNPETKPIRPAVFFGREGETGSGNGAYDDFKMFDRVLSADEIAELAKK